MNYKNYQHSRDAAWRLLIDLKVRELPIRPGAMCKALGIAVKYYAPEDGNDGMSFLNNGVPTILVSSAAPLPRQRFTAAHELGHIVLGHVGRYALVNREPSVQDDPVEQAANVFASRLLAPACVLWGCNARTAEEIAELCDISLQAARFRAERMAVLYRRDKFLTSPMEREVYRQFADYITGHRL
jgi:Zn-dependent peptidase ImmA (M78 family)